MKTSTYGMLALGVLVTLGLGPACRKESGASQALGPDSCAFAAPERSPKSGFCDTAPPDTKGCSFPSAERANLRESYRETVRAVQLAWASSMQSTRLIERLESDEVKFTPELGQRLFETMFRIAKIGKAPQAPTTEAAFLEALKCVPRTWASARDEYALLDEALSHEQLHLPDPEMVRRELGVEIERLLGNP